LKRTLKLSREEEQKNSLLLIRFNFYGCVTIHEMIIKNRFPSLYLMLLPFTQHTKNHNGKQCESPPALVEVTALVTSV